MNEWQAYEHKGGQKKKLQLVDVFDFEWTA